MKRLIAILGLSLALGAGAATKQVTVDRTTGVLVTGFTNYFDLNIYYLTNALENAGWSGGGGTWGSIGGTLSSQGDLQSALDAKYNVPTGTPDGTKFLRDDGTWQSIPGGGDALTANPLSQFAATTSAQLKGVISDETGSSGVLVFDGAPILNESGGLPPVRLVFNSAASGFILNRTANANVDTLFYGGVHYSGVGADYLFFGNSSPDTDLVIEDGGFIGMGTATPATKLDVVGTITGDGLTIDGASDLNGTLDVSGTFTLSGLTASTVPYLDASKNLVSSSVTPTQLGYLFGVTSGIQTQLNGKQAASSDLDAIVALGNNLFVKTDGSGAATGQASILSTDLASTTGTGTTVVLSAGPAFTGGPTFGNGATSAGYLDILEDTDDGANYTRLQAQAMAGNITWTLPAAQGGAGAYLKNDGAGTLSWDYPAATGGAFSDAGDPVVMNNPGKDVRIGVDATGTGKLEIGGDADQTQLIIQGNATQTSQLLAMQDSAGGAIFGFTSSGNFLLNDTSNATQYIARGDDDGYLALYGGSGVNLGSGISLVGEDAALFAGDLHMIYGGGTAGSAAQDTASWIVFRREDVDTTVQMMELDWAGDLTLARGAAVASKFRQTQVDLNGGTTLTNGIAYYDSRDLSSNPTLTFSGTPAQGDVIRLFLKVTTGGTLNFPTSEVYGSDGTTTTSKLLWPGEFELVWKYKGDGAGGSEWIAYLPGPRNNETTSDPSNSTDDITLGYSVGSLWINTSNDTEWRCVDNTDGAAVWINQAANQTSLALADGNGVAVEGTPDAIADSSFQAFKLLSGMTLGYTASKFDLVYFDVNGKLSEADADLSEAAGKAIGFVTAAGVSNDTVDVLVSGIIRDDTLYNFTTNGITLYVDTVAGAVTNIPPSASGAVVKAIGWTIDADNIYVDVTPHWLVNQ